MTARLAARVRRLAVPLIASPLAASAILLFAPSASAGGPEFYAHLTGRAKSEWDSACPDAFTTGAACDANVCGTKVTLSAGPAVSRPLSINGTDYDLHDDVDQPMDLRAASLLNAICSVGGGDPFMAAAGSFAMQNAQVEAFMANAGLLRTEGQVTAVLPGPTLTIGGAYERGTDTNAAVLPVAYAKNLSDKHFLNVQGSLLYGKRTDLSQFGFNISPALGYEMRKPKTTWGFGGFVPLAYASASLVDTDAKYSAYTVGLGGIATVTTLSGRTVLSAGMSASARKTSGTAASPITIVGRAVHPLSVVADGYATASFGTDPLGSGASMFSMGAGAAFGNKDFGLRGFIGSAYKAVLLGFTWRMELEGAHALQRPAEPAASPEKKTEPVVPPGK